MTITSKRAEHVSLLSVLLSALFFVSALMVARWSGSSEVLAVSWLILSATLVWLVLVIQFHQRSLAEQEKLDISQVAEAEEGPTIFQAQDERAALFAVAQRRLVVLEKWFIPVFAALIAAYQVGIGLYLLKTITSAATFESKQPLVGAVFMTVIAFVSFLISRYATGMAAQPQWKPLRAGGSISLGVSIVCFLVAISLAFAQFKVFILLTIMGWAITILLLLLGLETALNVVLDIYRPRIKGQYRRSAFDSGLLGIINEPGGIFHTLAGAIDYQFGFKVSQTWFYKLLEKAVVPLILFGALVLYLLSCIVVLAPNEQAIIEHFGNPKDASGHVRAIGPGLSLKWPWPVDIAYKYPTKKIMEISIGYLPKVDPKTKEIIRESSLLWGKAHYEHEDKLLVASEQTTGKLNEGAVPVSFVMLAVPVQYRVKDLYSFIYNHTEPEKLLEAICYRELTKFAASAKIEVGTEPTNAESLLGAGRARAKQILTDNIQKAADQEGLGVQILFVGLQGIHPPPDVAPDYQKVVGAVQKKQALILNAEAEKNKTLSTLAGSVEDANELYSLAAQYQAARQQNNTEKTERLGKALDKAFARARGDIFSTLRQSQSYAYEKVALARAAGVRFAGQLKAFRAAEEIYKREQRLAVLEDALKNIRKFVVVANQNDTQVFIVDLQEKLTPSLYELGGLEEKNKK